MSDGRFKPGENGYTKTVPDDLRQARKINKTEVERVLNKYLSAPFGELQAQLKDPNNSTLEVLVMSVLITAIKRGDHDRLNFVLDRLIGKVKDDGNRDRTLSFNEQVVNFIEAFEVKHERIE